MSTYRFYFLCLFIVFCGLGCQEKKGVAKEVEVTTNPSDTIVLPKLLGLKPKLRLTSEAQKATKNWRFYQEVTQTLDSIKGVTIGQTRKYVSRLDRAYANLQEQLEAEVESVTPSEMTTQPIQARLAALETQIKVLNNELLKNDPQPDRIAASIVQSKNALQDLNLQIDERFALSIEELLEAANETIDSTTSAQPLHVVRPELNKN
jgi:septal ring factor EnvC (AmiA/AmiB activator)